MRKSRLRACLSAFIIIAASLAGIIVPSSPVGATNDVTLSASGPARVLIDTPSAFSVYLQATNPNGGSGNNGYNGSFRVVLPLGVSLTSSSATVSNSVPITGGTALIFENVGDIQEGSSLSISLGLTASTTTFPVGSTVTIDSGFYTSEDPRYVPDFNGADATASGDFDGSATTSFSTLIVPIDIEKSSPTVGAEDEMLRGLHDHVNTYFLETTNNGVANTNNVIVDDFLPANLEFLGCGATDNTTSAPTNPGSTLEYPGADALTATSSPTGNCPTPALVEMVTISAETITSGTASNGTPGPTGIADGVYTHIQWDLGTMTPNQVNDIYYQVAAPIRANDYDANMFAPGGASDPTANLDNNAGPHTNETASEQQNRNWATAGGTYTGAVAGPGSENAKDIDDYIVTLEDLSIHKSVIEPGAVLHGSLASYSLLVETGEYRSVSNMTIVDTMPDGLCPMIGGTDPETIAPLSGECAGAAAAPSPSLTNLTENSDGTWDLQWDFTSAAALTFLAPSSSTTLTYLARVRDSYQEGFADNAPVNGADGFTNTVFIDGFKDVVVAPDISADDNGDDGMQIFDTSSASFSTDTPDIDKSVSIPTAPGVTLDCNAATWVRTNSAGAASPSSPAALAGEPYAYRPGDRVCYRLGVDLEANMNYRNARVDDFMPPGYTFEQFWGTAPSANPLLSDGETANNNAFIDSVSVNSDLVTWDLGEIDADTIGGPYASDLFVNNGATRFEVVFSAIVGDPQDLVGPDIVSNLQKFTSSNINGATVSLRDHADVQIVEPHVAISKSDFSVDYVEASEVVPHIVTVTNDFAAVSLSSDAFDPLYATALDVSVWDILPIELTCSDLQNFNGATPNPTGISLNVPGTVNSCTDGVSGGHSVIDWTIDSLAPGDAAELTYSYVIPAAIGFGQTLVNNTGVRSFGATNTNTGSPAPLYIPGTDTDNIDSSLTPTIEDVLDDEQVLTRGLAITKTQRSLHDDNDDQTPDQNTNVANAAFATTDEEATIGELIEYRIRATIAQNTTVFDARLTDTLPTNLGFESLTSASVYLYDGHAGLDATLNGFSLSSVGQQINLVFPSTYKADATDAPAPGPNEDDIVEYVFQVRVLDSGANTTSTVVANSAAFEAKSTPSGPTESTSTPAVSTQIVEPDPQITKTATNAGGSEVGQVTDGDTVTYTLVVTNPHDPVPADDHVSNAYDVVVLDTLPEGVTISGGTDGGVFTPDAGDTLEGTIQWTSATTPALAVLAPGDTVSLTYDVIVDSPAVAGASLLNTATVSATTLAGTPTGERTTYNDNDAATIVLPEATLSKDEAPFGGADKQTYNVGETVDFQVTATVASGTRVFGAGLFDTLPSELDFDSYLAHTATDCQFITDAEQPSESVAPLLLTDILDLAPDGQILGWYLGDLEARQDGGGPGDCIIELSYRAHVNATAVTGDNPQNTAVLAWEETPVVAPTPVNVSDLATPPTDLTSGTWDAKTAEVSDDIDILEPFLEIDKDVTLSSGTNLANPSCDTSPFTNQALSDDADGTLNNGCDVEAGSRLTYSVSILNTGDGEAHDTTVVDNVPIGLIPVDTASGTPVADGGAVAGSGVGVDGTWDGTGRTITWDVTSIAAQNGGTSDQYELDYDVVVAPSDELQDNEDLSNSVDIPTYYGMSAADRVFIVTNNPANNDIPTYGDSGTRHPVYGDIATVEVHFPDLAITKSHAAPSDDTDARFDEPFNWLLTITNNDETATAYDLDLVDVLPTGWTYVANSAVFTVGGVPGSIEPVCVADVGSCATEADNNIETLTWTDAVSSLAPGASFTVAMQATPESEALAPDEATGIANTGWDSGAGQPHTNQATVTADDASGSSSCCDPDGVGPTPAPEYTASTSDTVYIRRADLEVTKSVSPTEADADPTNGPYWFGSFISYTISVTNTGPDDAADVVLEDVLDGTSLIYTSIDQIDQGTFTQTGGTGTQWGEWNVGTVASGATLELVIRVQIGGVGVIDNVAEVTESSTYDPDSDPDNSTTDPEDDDDSVQITSVPSMLGDYVWLDLNGDGVQDAGEAGIPDITVSITYTSPITGLAVTDNAVTDALGNYGFANLPTNVPLTVAIDYTNLVLNPNLAGLTPSFEFDGGADQSSTATIDPTSDADGNGTPGRLDLDFGFEADVAAAAGQSLGNRVWWDQDNSADASDGVGEFGLENITVSAVWAGFDGIAGNADDQTYVTTTDATGTYLFDAVPPGNYVVTLDNSTLPAGFDVRTFDQDGIASANTVTAIVLTPNEEQLDLDFSYRGTGSIGDTVWYDLDGDGVQDTGPAGSVELGISGVTVNLTWTDPVSGSTTNLSATTDANGEYLFENLPYGDYVVTVDGATLPVGLTQTYDADGLASALSSSLSLSLADNTDLDQDFGFRGTGSIGDTVWYDVDAGGDTDPVGLAFDADDVAIVGADVDLVWAGPDGTFGTVDDYRYLATAYATTTDVDGTYLFGDLPFGEYRVEVDASTLPEGMDEATFDADGIATAHQSTTSISVATPDDLDQDFSYTGTAELGDYVWLDNDGDGEQQASEAPIENVRVTLYLLDPADPTNPILIGTADTDANGSYLFDHLIPGDYVVTFDQPGDFVPTGANETADPATDSDGSIIDDGASPFDTLLATPPVTIAAGDSNHSVDQGFYQLASLGNLVWFDLNVNGIQDGGEILVADVVVNLLDGDGNPVLDNIGLPRTTLTAVDGTYLFDNLAPGVYMVEFQAPTSQIFTLVEQGLDEDSDNNVLAVTGMTSSVSLVSGETNLTVDAGLFDDATIGNFVWEDYDLDGLQDAGEPGVAGVTVALRGPGTDGVFDTADDVELASTVTSSTGAYLFDGLAPGDYQVRVVVDTFPEDMVLTVRDAGNDDAVDSDADVTTGILPSITLTMGEENLSLDAGLYTPYDLTVTKTVSATSVTRGQSIDYAIVINNAGPGIVREQITVRDTLPAGLTFGSVATPDGWSCSEADEVVTCISTADIAVDAPSTIIVTTTVTGSTGSNITNQVEMESVSTIGIDGPDNVEVATAVMVQVQSSLPVTGGNSRPIALYGAMLLALGGVLALIARMRLVLLPAVIRRRR